MQRSLPDSVGRIAPDAFEGIESLTIYGKDGSYAKFYAGKRGFDFVNIDDDTIIMEMDI